MSIAPLTSRVELTFKAPSESEPHLLIDLSGVIPVDLLDKWTAEFRGVWEKHGGSRNPFKHTFQSQGRSLPCRFDVSFRGTGRDRCAMLVSCDSLIDANQSAVRHADWPAKPLDWRESMIQELTKSLDGAQVSLEGRYFIDSAERRFHELLRMNPERVSLLVFGAFVAVSHERAVQDGDHVLSALYDGASAELHRVAGTVEDSVESPVPPEAPSVFVRFSRMLTHWVSLS